MRIKIRRIKHRHSKFFGFPDEKWARGGGKNGYARHYGHNCPGGKFRTKMEEENDRQRKIATSSDRDFEKYTDL